MKDRVERILWASETDFWRRAAIRFRRERIANEYITKIMEITYTITEDIRSMYNVK